MTEPGGLPEVQFESTVCLFRGSPLTVTEVTILLISCYPQHWPSPMSWSALTLSEERCASLTCNWSIRTSFLRLLVWLFRQLNMSKKTCFAITASYLWKCSSDTREDACNHTTDWCNFSIDMGFHSCCQKICHPFRQMIFPFRLWLPSNLVQARTSALFVYDVRSLYHKL